MALNLFGSKDDPCGDVVYDLKNYKPVAEKTSKSLWGAVTFGMVAAGFITASIFTFVSGNEATAKLLTMPTIIFVALFAFNLYRYLRLPKIIIATDGQYLYSRYERYELTKIEKITYWLEESGTREDRSPDYYGGIKFVYCGRQISIDYVNWAEHVAADIMTLRNDAQYSAILTGEKSIEEDFEKR